MTGTTRWWWVRHAAVINPDGTIYGSRDLPADLSDSARFRALADFLPREAVWVTTPLRRARDTARQLSGWVPPPRRIVEEDAFREQAFGDWEGLRWDDIPPETSRGYWADPVQNRAPGGESFVDVVDRVAKAMDRLQRDHVGRDIVAVCHAGAIRAALSHALDGDARSGLAFRIAPLSITRIDAIGHGSAVRWRVSGVNLFGSPG